MKANTILMLMLIPVLAGMLTACGEEQAESSYIPETASTEQKQTYPVLTTPGGNVEFVDAPETAPVIIDGDELPTEEPVSEIYQSAPDIMPDAGTP
ncbi:MAG: hypothetical protein E7496_02815 [Ruminococcus sp.]|nr:hypothetical protein [Ruminococcus sp.]